MNMKRYITSVLLALLAVAGYGQSGVYTKAFTNNIWNRGKFDSVLTVPRTLSATNAATYNGASVGDSGRLGFFNGKFWGHYGAGGWLELATGSSSVPSWQQTLSVWNEAVTPLKLYRNVTSTDNYDPYFSARAFDVAGNNPYYVNFGPAALGGVLGARIHIVDSLNGVNTQYGFGQTGIFQAPTGTQLGDFILRDDGASFGMYAPAASGTPSIQIANSGALFLNKGGIFSGGNVVIDFDGPRRLVFDNFNNSNNVSAVTRNKLLLYDTVSSFVTTNSVTNVMAGYGFLTQTAADARYPQLSGSYANPSWISSLAYSKLTGAPTALPTTSNLQTVTDNGAVTNLSITAPELKASGTTDLSLSAPGSHSISFKTNGVERGVFDAGGSFGIGLTPNSARGSLLEVAGNIWSEDAYILGTTSTPTAEFYMAGSNAGLRMMNTNDFLFARNASTEMARFKGTNGNLLINTTTDNTTHKLQVNGGIMGGNILANGELRSVVSGINTIVSSDGTNGIVGTTTNQGLVIRTNNTDKVLVTAAGDVGIGAAPTSGYKLDVGGLATLTGANTALNMGEGNANLVFLQAINRAGTVGKDLAFYSTTENMRILANGQVGIGTGSPDPLVKLDIRSPNGTGSSYYARMAIGQEPGTSARRMFMGSGSEGSFIHAQSWNGSAWVSGEAVTMNALNVVGNIDAGGLSTTSFKTAARSVDVSTTILDTDHTIVSYATSGNPTITLPSAVTYDNRILVLVDEAADRTSNGMVFSPGVWYKNANRTSWVSPEMSSLSRITVQAVGGKWVVISAD